MHIGLPQKLRKSKCCTDLFGETGQIAQFALQKGQVRPEEWNDERAQREVGDILQRVVELLDRYAVTLQHRQDQVQNPAIALYLIARGTGSFFSRITVENYSLLAKLIFFLFLSPL